MSHLSVHMVNRLLRENQKSIPNIFNGKNFKKCNPPDFKFYLGKINNKTLLHMVQYYFCVCFHFIKQYKKSKENLTLHHMGKIFFS